MYAHTEYVHAHQALSHHLAVICLQLTLHVVLNLQVSHSVSVTITLPGITTKLIHVECNEPQTIYELLLKHNISCSQVWNTQMSLSANSPCLALEEHNMRTINANSAPWKDDNPAAQQNFYYHNMKFMKVNTRHNVMRHKPYAPPKRAELTVKHRTSNSCPVDRIPVGIYYQDSMSKLKDVIIQDGRFIDSLEVVRIQDYPDDIEEKPYPLDSYMGIGHCPVLELEPDTTLLIGNVLDVAV